MQEPSTDRTTGVSANLQQILDLILDKGLVVDLAPRLSLGGIEILSVGVRVVIASADTFLQHAEQIDKIGRPHRPDSTKASRPTLRRTTKKRSCGKRPRPSASVRRKRRVRRYGTIAALPDGTIGEHANAGKRYPGWASRGQG